MISYIIPFCNAYAELQSNTEKWKERIKREWRESRNYPRKKKKRVRKELNIEWSVASYNPFE
jgi:hypothetical protein